MGQVALTREGKQLTQGFLFLTQTHLTHRALDPVPLQEQHKLAAIYYYYYYYYYYYFSKVTEVSNSS